MGKAIVAAIGDGEVTEMLFREKLQYEHNTAIGAAEKVTLEPVGFFRWLLTGDSTQKRLTKAIEAAVADDRDHIIITGLSKSSIRGAIKDSHTEVRIFEVTPQAILNGLITDMRMGLNSGSAMKDAAFKEAGRPNGEVAPGAELVTAGLVSNVRSAGPIKAEARAWEKY